MQDCIASLSAYAGNDYEIIALVHDEKQYLSYPNVRYIAYPKSRKSWFHRLFYEYIGFYKLSKQLKPYCWFSLHDTTPNVVAEKRMVYCHNTFSFYHAGLKGLFTQPGIFMFSVFSKYIHWVNIHKNDYVIVQQEWLRDAFEKMFAIRNVVVSLPVQTNEILKKWPKKDISQTNPIKFFYPATPMIHKNFEVICEAASILEIAGIHNFEVKMTLAGTENKYAKKTYHQYKSYESLQFCGFLNKEEMDASYLDCDCLLFPSKIESWGLPITEMKEYDKPVIAANLPYSKETVGKYDKAKFFDPDNAIQLAGYMNSFITHTLVYDETETVKYREPFFNNWDELIRFLFKS
jgi:glycosyltransferase involved in cell wall biosynthesis